MGNIAITLKHTIDDILDETLKLLFISHETFASVVSCSFSQPLYHVQVDGIKMWYLQAPQSDPCWKTGAITVSSQLQLGADSNCGDTMVWQVSLNCSWLCPYKQTSLSSVNIQAVPSLQGCWRACGVGGVCLKWWMTYFRFSFKFFLRQFPRTLGSLQHLWTIPAPGRTQHKYRVCMVHTKEFLAFLFWIVTLFICLRTLKLAHSVVYTGMVDCHYRK